MSILRGGIVGAGAWSAIQLEAWSQVKHAKITALCDRHPDRSASVRERFNIDSVYTDCEEMIKESSLDFIDICTRPYSHESLVTTAIENGLPVLCQKPFCESVEIAESLARLGEENDIPIVVNENFRWQSWYQKIGQLLEAGEIGVPFLARFLERESVTMPRFKHDQKYLSEMPQLLLYEMGVHYLDTFRFLFGDPQSVFARTHCVSGDVAGEDAYLVVLNYSGLTATIQNSWASRQVAGYDIPVEREPYRPPPIFEVEGSKGTLLLRPNRTLELHTHDNKVQSWTFSEESRPLSRVAAQQDFIDCLISGRASQTRAAETVKTMRLVHSAYESARTGNVIPLIP